MAYLGLYSAHVDISAIADHGYQVQFKYVGLDVEKDSCYVVRFAAKASHQKKIGVWLGKDSSPWTGYGLSQAIEIGQLWQEFEFHFWALNTDHGDARLSFMMGYDTSSVWIDAVEMRSIGNDITWRQIYTEEINPGYWQGRGLETTFVSDVAVDLVDPNRIYVGYLDVGLLVSEDGGTSYRKIWMDDERGGHDVFSIVIDPEVPNTIYLTAGESQVWGEYGNVLKSIDRGETWEILSSKNPDSGLPYGQFWSLVIDTTSAKDSRTLYVTCARGKEEELLGGIYKSKNGGETWFAVNNGLSQDRRHVITLAIDPFNSQRLYAGIPIWWGYGKGGVYFTENGGESWNASSLDYASVWKVVASPHEPGVVYATTYGYENWYGKGTVYKSTDYGRTFVEKSNGLGDSDFLWVKDLEISPMNPDILFACTSGEMSDDWGADGIFKTEDGGNHWFPVNDGLGTLNIYSLFMDPVLPNRLFAGSGGNGLFVGTDEDLAVESVFFDFPQKGWYMVGSVRGNVSFTNPDDNPDGMVLTPAYTWDESIGNYVPADTLKEKMGYWVAVLGACDLTIDNTGGLSKASTIARSQQDLFSKQYGSTPPKPPVINWETGEILEVPTKFALYQNYPNPFSARGGSAFGGNPTTTIAFDLPKESHVEIVIYNVMGQKVVTLLDKDFSAGSHEVLWDGRDDVSEQVSSGVYLCRIKAGEFHSLKKLVLVR